MKIRIVSVGTKAPAWVCSGFAEYAKRMPPDLPVELIEIPAPKHLGDTEKFMQVEAAKMTAQVDAADWVVALDEHGKSVSSVELAKKLDRWRMQGQNVVFLVGGSDGLGQAARERANEKISLSTLTFPHYVVRVILAEALYRAWSISVGHPYHRA
jgi:23S rRNA (pseudouridine1915-N3)-methyltransferase